jgi:hypothetical protein
MPLATPDDVRDIGRLPATEAQLGEDVIVPHLDAAARELCRWLGDYETTTDRDKKAACIEAECCLAMANLLPVLNTFYTAGLPTLQKELGDLDFIFHNPDDLQKIISAWRSRAYNAVAFYQYVADDPTANWVAI